MGIISRLRMSRHAEHQYLDLVRNILTDGVVREGRNGSTRAVFGATMRFPLEGNTLPLLTTKTIPWKICLNELLWFMRGQTDNRILQDKGVKIWDGNATRSFLDSRGLQRNRTGDLGPVYGHQWRHFNARYISCDHDYTGQGVDQLQNIATALRNPTLRTSRRLVMTAWNPCQIDDMALPPCHALVQFSVDNQDGLSCALYQRSGDIGLGVPFNIASYSMLTHILAHHSGLHAKELVHFLGDAHIYEAHQGGLMLQVRRSPTRFPRVVVSGRDNLCDYDVGDLEVTGYSPHPKIHLPMAA